MTRRLATSVVLTDVNGGTVTYRAGSTPPDEVAERITNPDAWLPENAEAAEVAVVPVVVQQNPPAPSNAPGVNPPNPPPPSTPPADSGSGDPGQEPARNGKTEAWKAYAEGLGQAVEADAGRDEIIAQLVAAGLIQE